MSNHNILWYESIIAEICHFLNVAFVGKNPFLVEKSPRMYTTNKEILHHKWSPSFTKGGQGIGLYFLSLRILVRRRKKRSKGILLNKYKVGMGLAVLGGLFFFSFYLAQGSPILDFLKSYASIAFGDIGLNIFFGLCILVGILIIAKGYLMKLLIRQFMIVMVIISGILNFPIIDGEIIKYERLGGYISRPVIFVLNALFGGQAVAIKVFIIVALIGTVGRILYSLNFSLPKLNIHLHQDERPKDKLKAQSAKRKDEEEEEESKTQTIDHGFIRTLLKDKFKKEITQKIENKERERMSDDKHGQKTLDDKRKVRNAISYSSEKPTYSLSLLEINPGEAVTIDETFLMEKAKALQEKLLEFNVPISIEGFDIGPSIVQMRIKPDSGIRIQTIESLTNDIALSLKSKSLRIVAPIPGTDCVGIQLPNPKPMMVRLGDILSSPDFANDIKKSDNNLSLGKAIDGSIVIKTLESMPHLLVAGATGSGKSVGVNDFILSLMYQNTPSELKFLMVDPKQVELELYSGLPYMLAPIVFESEKALKLLKRTVQEMETRYGLLKDKRVKNIMEYNAKIIGEKMYRIVFVIDELADMMMGGHRKDVEICITRIAQKARAVGIHLIVATQRPSVNVITGLIKANMPTRIAFGVVSEIDSRTILGRKGAETLLGKGDMLYIDPSTKFPNRLQAPFVSTEEIERVVQHLKNKYMEGLNEEDIYNQDIVNMLESKMETGDALFSGGDAGNDEELVQQAIEVVSQTRKASATLLQRKLNVGFARAARIMDIMEDRGLIGPQDGAKPRDIFM